MKPLVSNELWKKIEPLLPKPKERRHRYPGRLPLSARQILCGIIFVLKTGIKWDDLPAELGLGCGKTCRTHLRLWQKKGVWDSLKYVLLAELNEADKIDWDRASIDSSSVRSPLGGEATGPNPTDRRKLGSKHNVIVSAEGIPLEVITTPANRHDSQVLVPLLNALPSVPGKVGHPRKYPKVLLGDRAFDSEGLRDACRVRGIDPQLARRRTPHGSGLGKFRWVAERTLSWLHQFRKVGFRRDRLIEVHNALITLACCLIYLRFL